MEEIISDLEDYEGNLLYDYRMIFYSINKKQRDYLIHHFQEYSWGMGLAIAHCTVSEMPKVGFLKSFSNNEADIEFQFKSVKRYTHKDDEWTQTDLEELLDTRLVGKEQFLSNIFYSDQGLEVKNIKFYDQENTVYKIEISKYGGIHKEIKSWDLKSQLSSLF